MKAKIKVPKGWRKLRAGTIPTRHDREHNGSRWLLLPKDVLGPVENWETVIRRIGSTRRKK